MFIFIRQTETQKNNINIAKVTIQHGDDCDQPPPTPSSFRQLVFPLWVIGLFLLPQLGCACQFRLYWHLAATLNTFNLSSG